MEKNVKNEIRARKGREEQNKGEEWKKKYEKKFMKRSK